MLGILSRSSVPRSFSSSSRLPRHGPRMQKDLSPAKQAELGLRIGAVLDHAQDPRDQRLLGKPSHIPAATHLAWDLEDFVPAAKASFTETSYQTATRRNSEQPSSVWKHGPAVVDALACQTADGEVGGRGELGCVVNHVLVAACYNKIRENRWSD